MHHILANTARITRTFALAIWVGGLIFFVVVAAVAFGNLPSTHEAGIVVRSCLLAVHNIGFVSGLLYLLATLLFIALGHRRKVRAVELALVALMLAGTWYSQDSIIPTMENDRTSLFQQYGTEVDATPRDAPAHAEFDRLHNLSTKVEGTVLLLGLITLALGAIQPKPHTT
jgi:hypothetical protein